VELAGKAWTAFLRDDEEGVKTILPELEARLEETSWDENLMADMHFFLGEVDEGFHWLERVYSRNKGSLLGIKNDPLLDGVRTDPRYLDLLKRLGLD
jgi:hypothetical protein